MCRGKKVNLFSYSIYIILTFRTLNIFANFQRGSTVGLPEARANMLRKATYNEGSERKHGTAAELKYN
jgi:high-affinity K+ transport system ATPase subunit B